MKVTVFGTGYVGLVTGACLAESGHEVLCMDVDTKKIEALDQGRVPIYEPGLEIIVADNRERGTLTFSSNVREAVDFADILFIAVGTPPDEDGSADLQYVLAVAEGIGREMDRPKTVINKSTVPVGTADRVRQRLRETLAERNTPLAFEVASNPEFLKEGAAVADFMKPDRIIIGTDSEEVRKQLSELYAPFNRSSDRILFMDVRAAELTKYAANAMLATKISFMNEMANLAESLGADIEQVRLGIGSDPRIGYHFIYPGIGFGGSCFPKDVQALERMAREQDQPMELIQAVDRVNQRQKQRLIERIRNHYGDTLRGKVFAVWGTAFKPRTDDMREAPSRVIMEALWQAGARIQAYDPEALEEVERLYGPRDDLRLMGTRDAALQVADALIICTEWQHFRVVDFAQLAGQLADRVIFDGRNLYDPATVARHGLRYYAIGRGDSLQHIPGEQS